MSLAAPVHAKATRAYSLAALRKEHSKELVFALKTPDNLRPTEQS